MPRGLQVPTWCCCEVLGEVMVRQHPKSEFPGVSRLSKCTGILVAVTLIIFFSSEELKPCAATMMLPPSQLQPLECGKVPRGSRIINLSLIPYLEENAPLPSEWEGSL